MSAQERMPRHPFNTPLECGLRSLFVLSAIAPTYFDLQRLVYYDYILVHSGDISNGPPSLHPPVPHRSGEWLVRRNIVSNGLDLMFSRELLNKRFDNRGIAYGATDLTTPFLQHLTGSYAEMLYRIAQWLARTFESYTDSELSGFMTASLGRWGAEFTRESVVRGL